MNIKGLRTWFKHDGSDDSTKFGNDLFLCNANTYTYFEVVLRLLKYLNLDPYDIVLICKPKK